MWPTLNNLEMSVFPWFNIGEEIPKAPGVGELVCHCHTPHCASLPIPLTPKGRVQKTLCQDHEKCVGEASSRSLEGHWDCPLCRTHSVDCATE
jgi:hypothetical protein